jgi:hypothetical protein
MSDDGLNHPADKLALVRQRIKKLQDEEADLKAACVALPESERAGRYAIVSVAKVGRSTLDTKALREALGEAAVEPYMKQTEATVVTVKEIGA